MSEKLSGYKEGITGRRYAEARSGKANASDIAERVNKGKPKPSLFESVYNHIKDEIVTGRLQPGEPLFEEALAQKLNVSRTPIREALRRLNHDGLVRLVPNKGAFVRLLTPKDIREVYELREAVESYAAGKAAACLSTEHIDAIARVARDLKRRGSSINYKDVRDAWEMLRQLIRRAVENERMSEIMLTMNEQIETARHYSSAPEGRLEELSTDFTLVVNALKNRDGIAAAKLVQLHLRKSKEVLLSLFERGSRVVEADKKGGRRRTV